MLHQTLGSQELKDNTKPLPETQSSAEPSTPTLRRLSSVLIGTGILFSMANWLILNQMPPGGPILITLGLVARWLVHINQPRWSARLVCGSIAAASLASSYSIQGLFSVAWVGVPLAIMASGWLLGRRSALILTVIGVAAVIVMYGLHELGYSSQIVQPNQVRALVIIVTMAVSFVFAQVIADSYRRQWNALSESKALLSSLFDSTDNLVWSVDPVHFGIMDFNAAAKNYFTEELGIVLKKGLQPRDILAREDLIASWMDLYRYTVQFGSAHIHQLHLGDLDRFEVRLNVMQHNGVVFGISVFAHNLMEELRAEEKLEEEYEFQNNLIDSIPGILMLMDEQGRLIRWNRNLQNFLGHNNQQMSKLYPIDDVFVAADRKTMMQALRQTINNGTAKIEASIHNGTDQHTPYLLNAFPVRWSKRSSILIIGVELTERKRLEHSWQAARDTAEQALAVRKRFLAHMSHELRTPMNAILGLSQFARDENSLAVLQNYLEKINFSAGKLLTIINDILDFSKIEADGIIIKSIPFRLRELIDDVLSVSELKAESKNLTLSCDIQQEIPDYILGDPDRFRQVLINLVDNAIKFTVKGSVTLGLIHESRDGSDIILDCSIQDTGIGISAENLNKLFQPFSQVDDATTRQYGGTGLGLVICSDLVKRMGGTGIDVDSQAGVGTRFNFRLPFKRIVLDHAQEAETPAAQPANTLRLDGFRILIVEDNAINQLVAKSMIERLGGISTMTENGQQAIDRLNLGVTDFDAVLMDIQMPVMDGHEATRIIRHELKLTHLPIIAVTAHAMENDLQQFIAEGMDACVTKPIDSVALVATLHRLVKTDNVPKFHTPEAVQATPQSIPRNWLDLSLALSKLEGDTDLYRELVEMFLQDNSADTTRIRECLAAANYPEAHRIAHTLKGLAGTLGLVTLRDSAEALDLAFKRDQYPQLETLTAQVEGELNCALAGLKHWLTET
ncbi:MAG: ATP-binding protein [Methylococcaceae bacterium]